MTDHDCETESVETATRPDPTGRLTITSRCTVCGRITSVVEDTVL